MKLFGFDVTRTRNAITSADLLSLFGRSETESGIAVSPNSALFDATVLRCISIISQVVGALPLHVYKEGEVAKDHPLHNVLKFRPNKFQTPFHFKSNMQVNLLKYGMAYARKIKRGNEVIGLYPIHPERVQTELTDNWDLKFTINTQAGSKIFTSDDIFYLSDITEDGFVGISRIDRAREAIGLAKSAEKATANIFKSGNLAVNGAVKHPRQLTDKQHARLKESLGGWMLLEDGMEPSQFGRSAADNQHILQRKFQIEEIARVFGVPRPLVMMDETAWGTGIEQLGIFFVQYGLMHWFTNWEEAINMQLIPESEKQTHYAKFNERALMRGTLNDQAQYFATALGSGGGKPWMNVNEVRELQDMKPIGDGQI